jgi:hypothetical protein
VNAVAREDPAVSSVVAAVLVFSLIVTASLMYTVNVLPDRIEAREANHQAEVRRALTSLQTALEALSVAGDAGPATQRFELAPEPVPFLQRASASALMEVQPGLVSMAATWPACTTVHLSNGIAVGAPGQAVPASPTLASHSGVASVRSLVAGLVTSGVNGNTVASMTLTATSSTTTVTAVLRHVANGAQYGCTGAALGLDLSVTGRPTTSQALLCGVGAGLGTAGNPYRVDLMAPLYGVAPALSTLPAPYSMTLTSTAPGAAITATYALVYVDANGRSRAVGPGETYTTPLAASGAGVHYKPFPFEYPQQDLFLEGGALVAVQADGQTVVAPPGFRLEEAGGTGFLTWTIVSAQGTGSRSGSGPVSVSVSHASTSDVLLQVPGSVTFTVQTPHAAAWASYFAQARTAAGLNATHVAIVPGSGQVQLTLQGGMPWTVSLRHITAQYRIE